MHKHKDSSNQDNEAYQDFLKDSGLSKRQIRQLQEFEQTFREINEEYIDDEEDSWY